VGFLEVEALREAQSWIKRNPAAISFLVSKIGMGFLEVEALRCERSAGSKETEPRFDF